MNSSDSKRTDTRQHAVTAWPSARSTYTRRVLFRRGVHPHPYAAGVARGGTCHYLSPSRRGARSGLPDGRNAGEVFALFRQEVRLRHRHPREYEVRMRGGGHMFAAGAAPFDMAFMIIAGRGLLLQSGFVLHVEQVGGDGSRHVELDLWSGRARVRQVPLQGSQTPP